MAKTQSDWFRWSLGGSLVIAFVVLFGALVPLLPCPAFSYDQDSGQHVYVGTHPPTCPLCRDSRRVTVLKKWLIDREYRVIEEHLKKEIKERREVTAPR